MRVAVTVALPARPERAWERLLEWERQAEWMKDADGVEVLTPQRTGVGVRLAVRTRVLGIPLFTETLEVVAWEPPRRLRLAHRSFVRGHGEWTLEAEGTTRSCFTWTEDIALPIPLLGRLALLVYRPVLRHLIRGSCRNLATVVARD